METGVKFKDNGPGNAVEGIVRFEDIGTEKLRQKTVRKRWLYASIFLLLLSIVLLVDRVGGGDVEHGAEFFYLSFGIVCFVIYLFTSADYVYLTGHDATAIQLFRNKPNMAAVEDFLDKILEARKTYLKGKYAKVDPDIPARSQMATFIALREQKIITTEEFEVLKQDLAMMENTLKHPIGFGSNQT